MRILFLTGVELFNNALGDVPRAWRRWLATATCDTGAISGVAWLEKQILRENYVRNRSRLALLSRQSEYLNINKIVSILVA